MVTVTFRCGHTEDLSGNEQSPHCWCGEGRITQVHAPRPKFRGYALGPCATFKRLKARAVDLSVKGNAHGK